ncbi:GtrA family protein [Streptomyces sp. NY05-11A]|uniref:GtrA family protein n=1 Tax=Streptomyces soliscabiei TaxID=588897 RepID=UPI0029A68851|nr:GtrA family protein [Streptomyces sp. NY05-11A]MDX2682268.1 GtrA family protein [Streptomyces sp. NY05-11A]
MPHGSSGLKRLFRELAKFGAVGGAGVLVNLGVFNLVRHLTELQVVRASVIATVVSIVFNYVGFRYFTYRDRDKSGRTKELTLFLLFSMVGLVIENGLLFAATYGFGWDSPLQSNVFKFVGIGIATLFRFWSYRTWVFRAPPVEEAVAGADSFLAAAEHTRPRPPEPQAPATVPAPAAATAAASATAAQRMR